MLGTPIVDAVVLLKSEIESLKNTTKEVMDQSKIFKKSWIKTSPHEFTLKESLESSANITSIAYDLEAFQKLGGTNALHVTFLFFLFLPFMLYSSYL